MIRGAIVYTATEGNGIQRRLSRGEAKFLVRIPSSISGFTSLYDKESIFFKVALLSPLCLLKRKKIIILLLLLLSLL